MKSLILIIGMAVLFAGCDFNPFEEAPALTTNNASSASSAMPDTSEKKELTATLVNKATLQARHEKEMADIAMQKEIARIEKQKAVALGELEQTVKLKEAQLRQKLELEQMKVQVQLAEGARLHALQRNLIILFGMVLLIAAFGLYVLLRRRHDNKLRAYNDNLQKYFLHKESETRARLAEKIIDKIAKDGTPTAQEQQLIEILKGVSRDDAPSESDEAENLKRLLGKSSQ